VSLDPAEASLVVSLVNEVDALLDSGPRPPEADPLEAMVGLPDAPAATPDNPILERLLPDGYRDDPEAATEFRRLTDRDLRATKREALRRIRDDIAAAGDIASTRHLTVALDEPSAAAWLHGLADVRLALGTQLGVTEDAATERASRPPGDPREAELAIYDWLTWLQDAIVTALPI
jgi:hypothetical protein